MPIDSIDGTELDDFLERFGQAHKATYGYESPDQAVFIVSCRLRAVGVVPKTIAPSHDGGTSLADAIIDERSVYFGPNEGWVATPIYRRSSIPVGKTITGPAIIEEMSSTTVILSGQDASVDAFGNILINN